MIIFMWDYDLIGKDDLMAEWHLYKEAFEVSSVKFATVPAPKSRGYINTLEVTAKWLEE